MPGGKVCDRRLLLEGSILIELETIKRSCSKQLRLIVAFWVRLVCLYPYSIGSSQNTLAWEWLYSAGRTCTCMKLFCALMLWMRICVPVFGTITLPIGLSGS